MTPPSVRPATIKDVPAVLIMGRQFFNAAGWPEVTTWDEGSVETTLRGIISGTIPGGLLVAGDDQPIGMIGFMVFPFYFNLSVTVAQEIFWWVEPQARFGAGIALLDAFEAAGAARGATVYIVSAVARMRNDALTRLYARRGYAPAENTFIRHG